MSLHVQCQLPTVGDKSQLLSAFPHLDLLAVAEQATQLQDLGRGPNLSTEAFC